MNFKIVKASEVDIPELISIRERAWHEVYVNESIGVTHEFLDELLKSEQNQKEYYQKYLNDPKSAIWVAKVNNKVVGFCHASKYPKKHEIERLYVNKEYQKQGIGQALLEAGEYWLGGDLPIRLTVVSYNPAVNFYKRNGYQYTRDVLEDSDKTPTGDLFYDIEMIKLAR